MQNKTTGGTRKIRQFDIKICNHSEHNSPLHIILDPGVYEHECPCCGKKQTFIIPTKPML